MAERKQSVSLFVALLLGVPMLGAAVGWWAGPSMARMNYVVQVAERVWAEESRGLSEETLQSTAFRVSGVAAEDLYAQVREIRDRFRLGGLLFGLWCGVVIGLKVARILCARGRTEYEADGAECVACGRCYLHCPVEHRRLGLVGIDAPRADGEEGQ